MSNQIWSPTQGPTGMPVSGDMPYSDDEPSAPPMDQMNQIPGYEAATFTPSKLLFAYKFLNIFIFIRIYHY